MTSDGGIGDFRRNILQTDFEENNSCKEIPVGKNFLHRKQITFMAYIPRGKNLTPLYIREKLFYQRFGGGTILTQTKSPIRPPYPSPPPTSKVKWSAPKESSIGLRLSSSIFNKVDRRDGTS